MQSCLAAEEAHLGRAQLRVMHYRVEGDTGDSEHAA